MAYKKKRSSRKVARRPKRTVTRKRTRSYTKKPRRTVKARRSVMRTANLSTGNRGGIIITHREFITDITPSVGFVKKTFDINAGVYATNPWLADIAAQYEQYNIRAMVFEYKSLCSDSTSVAQTMGLGSVIMGINYNPDNDPFIDKRSMENYSGASSKKPTENNIVVLDVSSSQNPIPGLKWCRSIPEELGDIRLYDYGEFSIATQGQPENVTGTIGELWIAYEVEFFKPKYASNVGENLLMDHYILHQGQLDFAPTAPFGVAGENAPIDVRPGFERLGTRLHRAANGSTAGYAFIKFGREHQGMTFLIHAVWANDNPINISGNSPTLEPVNDITTWSNVSAFNQRAQGGPLTMAGIGTSLGTANTLTNFFSHMIKIATNPSRQEFFVHYRFPDAHPLPSVCSMDLYVIQINGTTQTQTV